jgi:hypothetical protein
MLDKNTQHGISATRVGRNFNRDVVVANLMSISKPFKSRWCLLPAFWHYIEEQYFPKYLFS